jgi:hypothetical protein
MQPATAEKKSRVLPLRLLKSGWHVLTVHYSSVPGYDYAAASRGMTPEQKQQELEIDWSTVQGKRVYPEFGREHHVAVEALEFNPHRPLYCGWDFYGTPAFVPTQLNTYGQWLIFPPLAPSEENTIGIYDFGQIVADHLSRTYAVPHGLTLKQLKLVHFGDPSGAAPPPRTGDSPKEMRSAFDILRKGLELDIGLGEDGERRVIRKPGLGWRILPGKIGLTERLEAVRGRLTMTLRDGLPALVVDSRAEVIKEGFLGGYHYPQRRDGHYDYTPEKDYYSHVMDALAYVATRLFETRGAEEEDEDEDYRSEGFRSHAASRYD